MEKQIKKNNKIITSIKENFPVDIPIYSHRNIRKTKVKPKRKAEITVSENLYERTDLDWI